MLYDVIKVLLYGYIKDISFELDTEANLWYPAQITESNRKSETLKLDKLAEEQNTNHSDKQNIATVLEQIMNRENDS